MSKDILPIAAHQLRRLYNKLFAQPCFLCGDLVETAAICMACTADLPLLGPACQRCALPLTIQGVCGQCQQNPPLQQATFAVYRYQPPIDKCITAFKFHRQLSLNAFFVQAMLQQQQIRDALPDCLIPIPLHPHRLRHRGFNQSAELAKSLGKQLGIAVDLYQLKRIRHTAPQSGLAFKARQRNIKQAFRYSAESPPKHVALIDDVMTTGQTVAEASRCLLQGGVKHVEVWTIARTIRHY